MTPLRPPETAGTVTLRGGLIVYASDGVAALAGRSVDALVGHPFAEFIVEDERALVTERHARRLRGEPVPQRYEITLALPGGARRRVEIHVDLDGADVHVHVRDIALREARRLRLEAVATLGAALQRELTEEGIFTRLRDDLGVLGLSCALMRAQPEGVRVMWASLPRGMARRFRDVTGAPLEGYLGRWNDFSRRVQAEGSAFTEDWALAASRFVPDELAGEARATLSSAGRSRAVGVRLGEREDADLYLVVAGDWLGTEDAPALRLLATQLAAALGAARTIADLSRRNADLAALNRVAELASEASDLAGFLARTSEELRGAAGCAGIAVFVLDEAAGELVRAYADGVPAEAAARFDRFSLSSPLGKMMAGPTLGVLDTDQVEVPEIRQLQLRSVARIPLVARSKLLGILAAGFPVPAAEARARLGLLSAVAAHVAAAVESHGLLSDLRRRVGELTLLNDIALGAAQHDPVALLDAAVRRICETVGADVGSAYVRDGERLVLVAEAGIAPDCARSIAVLPVGEGAPGLAVARGVPVEAGSTEAYAGRCAGVGACGEIKAVVAVPLLAKAQARGAIVLGRREPRGFSAGELRLLSAIGVQLGLGLENARLYADARRRVEELSLLNEVGRTIAGSLDLDHVLREGADAARRLVDASRAVVLLYDPLRSELRFSGGVGYATDELERIVIPAGGGTVGPQAVRERRPIVVDDALHHPGIDERYRRTFRPRSLVAAPVLLRGEPLGVLVVDEHEKERHFTESDVERVTAVANQLAVAIENARLYAEARGRLQEISTVIDVARVVSSSLELEEVLGAGAEHLKATLEASACTILLLARGGELRRAASRGPSIGPDRVLADAVSLPQEALAARAPVAGRQGTPDAGTLAVPLHVREMPVGVALVAGGTPDRVFTPGELARATAIASQLAVAVDNARLYSETRRRAEELGLLHEVGRSLVETLDIQRLLERGVQNLARIVDAPAASLLLATADGRAVDIRAVWGPHGVHLGRRLPLDPPESSLAALVVHRREPIVVEDAATDPRVNAVLRADTGARGYLGLPLLVHERTIGAVIIMEPRGPRRFTPAEVERAAAIANQLAVAVENARLYEDLRLSYAELERAQHRLIQRERLAALGELSAVVAHEVRNPLGVIFNSLGSLRRLVRPTGDAKLLLDIVGEEADRLNRIVGDLLDFARPSTPDLRPERLEQVVEEAVGAALVPKPADVEIARDHDPALPPVIMDARLVRQAVLNIAVNAVQAMPRGGRLTLRTRRSGDAVVLEIEDTGAGIPAEVSARIFEPFFTTKASGTGLGLAVVKRIVEGHGGTIAVRNQPGSGAVFSLSFPVAASTVEKEPVIG